VGDVAVVIPARDEAARIAATVQAAAEIPGVDLVIVVDDGSRDATAELAAAAGARVLRRVRSRGKAAAMEAGAAAVARLEVAQGRDPRLLLFLDGDLEASAAAAHALIPPVRGGAADMTIAQLPPQRSAGGGHGFVVRLAGGGIRRATGESFAQPLSGQRCLTRSAFEAGRPLAHGFGVETALTIDLMRAGFAVIAVPCELHHRVTGSDWRAQRHRARQFGHVALALLSPRRIRHLR
jgi:glycosyl transferase family 2